VHGQDARATIAGFVRKLAGNRDLIRTYYYTAVVRREDGEQRYQEQQKFLERLNHLDYFQVKLGRLMPRGKR
jgi:hypothetical protein